MCKSLKTLSIWEFLGKVKWWGMTLTEEVKATAPTLIYNLNIISHPLSEGDWVSDTSRCLRDSGPLMWPPFFEDYSKYTVTEMLHCTVTSEWGGKQLCVIHRSHTNDGQVKRRHCERQSVCTAVVAEHITHIHGLCMQNGMVTIHCSSFQHFNHLFT